MVPVPNISWKESLKRLKTGSLHVLPSCGITPERQEYLLFTDIYISDPLIISTKREFEFVGNLNDLAGKRVVLPKDYYTVDLLKRDYKNIEIIEVESIEECLKYVSFGLADAFVGSLGVVSYYINHKGFTNLKIAAPTKYEDTKIAFAVTPEYKIFRDIVQKVLKSLTLKEKSNLRKKWISVRYEHGFSWGKAIYIFAIIMIVVFIGYLIFFLWNRSLKRQIKIKEKTQQELEVSISKIKKQNQEKKILLQEIHHRVKNNLQIIISLLRLQINKNDDEKIISSLNEAIERINAIALIHKNVYQSENLENISTESYITELAREIIKNFTSNTEVKLNVNAKDIKLSIENSLPIALIINELITNSIYHGFINKNNGTIQIDISKTDDNIIMTYFDNGKWIEASSENSLGITLINTFTEQLDGTLEVTKNQSGTTYKFNFKLT